MKTFVPNYYKYFRCIAGKCQHNCCIGWEIDIDKSTLLKYENIKGNFRKSLEESIDHNGECPSFRLDGRGRCVHLNEDNLCDIILNLGEDALCQICADHPRFRNYLPDRIEMGLGICCEEACRIILGRKEDFNLEVLSSDDEETPEITDELNTFYSLRNILFKLLENPLLSLDEKKSKMITFSRYDFPKKSVCEWVDIYLSLERLDEYWTILLNDLKETDIENVVLPEEFNLYLQNLMKYFVFRYYSVDYPDLGIILALMSEHFISYLCKMHIVKYNKITFEDFVEYARLYSSEIEYSDENIDELTYIFLKK